MIPDIKQAQSEWDRLKHHIQNALDRNGNSHSLEDVRGRIDAGVCQFWPGKKSAAVSEVVVSPGHTTFHIWLAGGSGEEILGMFESAEAYARSWGCTRMDFEGRPGWERKFRPPGWKTAAVILRKEF